MKTQCFQRKKEKEKAKSTSLLLWAVVAVLRRANNSDAKMSVCLSARVCLFVRDHIFPTTRPIFTKYLCTLPMAVARSSSGSLPSNTLCTSGFMDTIIFAHKPRLLDVAAQLKRSAHAALGLAINYAQANGRTDGTTFRSLKVTSHVATPGGRSLRSVTLLFFCCCSVERE